MNFPSLPRVLLLLSLCTLAKTPNLQAAQPASPPPNIVFIMVDDLGYGDLSAYGAPDLKTPNIDQLFASGMRFDQFYANCPVCSPTRAAFLSGRYPDMAGVPGVIRTQVPNRPSNNWGDLGDDLVLLPQLLKKANYHSALIGKWHLGLQQPDRPTDRGFDLFHGFLGDMMDDYYTHLRHGNNYMRLNEKTIDPKGHATDLFSDWAIDYLTERAQHKEQPFFLYLAYNAPHTPIQPPADWLAKVQAREKGISEKRAKIVALIEHLDHGTGRVLDALKQLDLSDNTLIVFTSDNGGHVAAGARNAPLHGGKQEMWEGGIRVCTAVSWPGKIAPGSRSQHRSLTMDFYPTLAEVAGAAIDRPIDARSFLPVLFGKKFTESRPEQVWMRLEGGRKYGGLIYHAIRIGDWKLLRNTPFEPYQMFNIANDPTEEHAIPREKAPKKFDSLFNKLSIHINRAGRVPWQRKNE